MKLIHSRNQGWLYKKLNSNLLPNEPMATAGELLQMSLLRENRIYRQKHGGLHTNNSSND